MREEPAKKKNPGAVKISPWALARLNAEEVSKAAAEARKKYKILQPVLRQNDAVRLEPDSAFSGSGRRMLPKIENNRKRASKQVRLLAELPMESLAKASASNSGKGFSGTISSSAGGVSSPESSLDSPDIHPFRASSSGAEETRRLAGLPAASAAVALKGTPLSHSTSDGYEASGGEDSDRVQTRIVQRSTNWTNILFDAEQDERAYTPKSSSSLFHNRNL